MNETPPIPERRRTDMDPWRVELERKVDETLQRVKAVVEKHDEFAQTQILNNAQTQEMYDLFSLIKGLLVALGKMYSGTVWLLTKVSKIARPLMYLIGLGIALLTALKTGEWKWP